jgi:RNA polymerase sigma factor for flagellar operon FliA
MDKRTTMPGAAGDSGPNPARELARAVACCRHASDTVSDTVTVPVGDLVAAVSQELGRRTSGSYDLIVAGAVTEVVHRHVLSALHEAESVLADAAGLPYGTFPTDDTHLTVLSAAGLGSVGLTERDLTAAGHPVAAAVATVRSVTGLLLQVSSGDLFDRLLSVYQDTTDPRGLDDLIAALTGEGVDAEGLCWALITFETTRHVNLVWLFANRMTRTFPEREAADLFGWGWQGLRRALRCYDPSRGFTFSTYAATRICGEIRDGVRQESHVPKRLTTYLRKFVQGEEDLAQQLGRLPSLKEVAAHLGEDLDRLVLVPRLADAVSVEELTDDSRERPSLVPSALIDGRIDPAAEAVGALLSDAVAQALAMIPEDERLAVRLLVMEGRDPGEVRELTGVDARRMRRSKERGLAALAAHLEQWRDNAA